MKFLCLLLASLALTSVSAKPQNRQDEEECGLTDAQAEQLVDILEPIFMMLMEEMKEQSPEDIQEKIDTCVGDSIEAKVEGALNACGITKEMMEQMHQDGNEGELRGDMQEAETMNMGDMESMTSEETDMMIMEVLKVQKCVLENMGWLDLAKGGVQRDAVVADMKATKLNEGMKTLMAQAKAAGEEVPECNGEPAEMVEGMCWDFSQSLTPECLAWLAQCEGEEMNMRSLLANRNDDGSVSMRGGPNMEDMEVPQIDPLVLEIVQTLFYFGCVHHSFEQGCEMMIEAQAGQAAGK